MDTIKLLIKENKLNEALVLLSELIAQSPENADAYFMRGKVYWRLGERSKATTDYATAATLNPDSPAAAALEQARDIEAFFNPDLLNP